MTTPNPTSDRGLQPSGPVRTHGRALDAVLNRLGEALRAIEDPLRFSLEAPGLARAWKRERHRLAALRDQIEKRAGVPLVHFRNTEGDSGAPSLEPAGQHSSTPYPNFAAQMTANVSRAREASRSLEEILRVVAADLAGDAEQLRYAIYRLESAGARLCADRFNVLTDARLYALVTTHLASGPLDEVTAAAIRGGVDVIQLREKDMAKRELLPLARHLRELCGNAGVTFLVNDHLDIAQLSGADGVHQGQDDLKPTEVRRVLGPDAIVGISTHGLDQAQQAIEDGADYIGVGPVFPTQTKEHRAAVGLDYVKNVAREIELPAFAIGSVDLHSIDSVLDAGAQRVAICTGIIAQKDVEAATRAFRELIDRRSLSSFSARTGVAGSPE